jgi:hypothetical protein
MMLVRRSGTWFGVTVTLEGQGEYKKFEMSSSIDVCSLVLLAGFLRPLTVISLARWRSNGGAILALVCRKEGRLLW